MSSESAEFDAAIGEGSPPPLDYELYKQLRDKALSLQKNLPVIPIDGSPYAVDFYAMRMSTIDDIQLTHKAARIRWKEYGRKEHLTIAIYEWQLGASDLFLNSFKECILYVRDKQLKRATLMVHKTREIDGEPQGKWPMVGNDCLDVSAQIKTFTPGI